MQRRLIIVFHSRRMDRLHTSSKYTLSDYQWGILDPWLWTTCVLNLVFDAGKSTATTWYVSVIQIWRHSCGLGWTKYKWKRVEYPCEKYRQFKTIHGRLVVLLNTLHSASRQRCQKSEAREVSGRTRETWAGPGEKKRRTSGVLPAIRVFRKTGVTRYNSISSWPATSALINSSQLKTRVHRIISPWNLISEILSAFRLSERVELIDRLIVFMPAFYWYNC